MQSQLTYAVDGLAFTVSFDRWDSLQPDRARWNWSIRETVLQDGVFAAIGEVLASGDDMTTVDGLASEVEALKCLFAFLGAWAEAVQSGHLDSHNASLFPSDKLLEKVDIDTWDQLVTGVVVAWGDDD